MKEIKELRIGEKIRHNELLANVIDNGHFFSATSFDNEYSCHGIIVDDNDNPIYKINNIHIEILKVLSMFEIE